MQVNCAFLFTRWLFEVEERNYNNKIVCVGENIQRWFRFGCNIKRSFVSFPSVHCANESSFFSTSARHGQKKKKQGDCIISVHRMVCLQLTLSCQQTEGRWIEFVSVYWQFDNGYHFDGRQFSINQKQNSQRHHNFSIPYHILNTFTATKKTDEKNERGECALVE